MGVSCQAAWRHRIWEKLCHPQLIDINCVREVVELCYLLQSVTYHLSDFFSPRFAPDKIYIK